MPDKLSDVIVQNKTLGSFPNYVAISDEEKVRAAVATFALKAGLTNREAAAVIAQSYGLRVFFS
jgi:hypothetical protein